MSALWADRERYVPSSYLQHHPIAVKSALGVFVEDTEGRSYLDFAGGIGVQNVGHRHPLVMESILEQLNGVLHTGPVTLHPGYVELAKEIAQRSPGQDNQVLFLNSGAEAVENAIKIARHASGRPGIIAFDRSFHGRTLLTSGLTGKARPYKSQPASLNLDIEHVPYPYPYRPPRGVGPADLVPYCIDALDDVIHFRMTLERVAAVIVEPVQGEGGYIVPPRGFLTAVREWCTASGVLMIVDEIQTGFGRTGLMLSCEYEAVQPDVLILGKSIAAGLPLAAVVAGRDVFERVPRGDVGGTYGGNPIACAAGLGVLRAINEDSLLERAPNLGASARDGLERISDKHEEIGEVRGLGPMLALEFVEPGGDKVPAPQLAARVVEEALSRGLLVIKAGVYDNVVRFIPPLVTSDSELDRGLEILAGACSAALSELQ